ncbi:cilia- and flagella-associated protein 65-like [Lingula anatina]|uniref:Cilia- and flagella-associated protein 65-like n=1 Tax=Lingula anatina TaxID=7574 RepID=A0A1S3JQ72_LINAN|nr:cilia- and flagella-associated protein 65-like [Lingula anatina]|eukprot:XP_013412505.1 cilia- and flagella-associated protein 65-like [Lingula anatina]
MMMSTCLRTKQPLFTQNSGKANYNGIEVVPGVVWQGWEPGREYTKNITLKNVKVKTQKLKYSAPSTRFFSTLYPKPIVLSAGTSFTLPVTFRPLEKNEYEDKIEFECTEGNFEVPIKAVLPKFEIALPELLNFQMCAVEDQIQLTFELKNTSELFTPFQWEVEDPFIIEPSEGALEPFTSCVLTATFKPKGASVYVAEAVCKYGAEFTEAQGLKLNGIGKYPHLLVSSVGKPVEELNRDDKEAVAHFGEIPVGKSVEKFVELHNLSPVNAPFSVQQPASSISRIDCVYRCPQKNGIVPPMSSVRIPIYFCPNTVGTTSIDYFHVSAIGNVSKTVIKCVGSSRGPAVELSTSVINFLQIDIGDTSTRSLEIRNKSDIEATFQFMLDCNESVFKLDKVCGTLKPDSYTKIVLKFQPSHPINYYRRVVCLVQNQGPLFLDLLGTCHSETMKPAVLQCKHVERLRVHTQRGLSFFPPEQLNELLKAGKLEKDQSGALMARQSEAIDPVNYPVPRIPPMDEFFNDGYYSDIVHTVPHASTDMHIADFGNITNWRVTEQKSFNITNHTKGKVTVQWMGGEDHVFSVVPSSMDIPPLKACSFRVNFKPNAPNQFYGAELECYVYYKSMRDYRLVEDTTHCPPWCITLQTTGHTFMPNNETFLPRVTLDTEKLVFPAVNTNEATYRTLLLSNVGTTPVLFDFEKDKSDVYSMKPTKGLLTTEHQMFVVRMLPKEVKTYKQELKLCLNDAEKNTKQILAWGSAESPNILLDNGGVVYFKPTCIGTASHVQYTVKNISRIPLRFEWKLKHCDAKVLSVTPEEGLILPNESQVHTWSFTPLEKGKYVCKPSLIAWGQGQSAASSGGKKKQFLVRAIGQGAVGEIKSEDSYYDFGNVIVGSSASQYIVLWNKGDCALHFKLQIEQTISGPYPEELTRQDDIVLELEEMSGVLPARSKKRILATVRPVRRVCYQFSISYQLVTPEDESVNPVAADTHYISHVLATGVYPTMAVTDARCYGSALGISKKQLWNLFSLDNLNMCVDSDPSAAELMYSVATRHSHRRRPPVYTRAILDFNFSAAPVNSEPCTISLMVENTGAVPTEWAFLFPCDLQLELEYWAETGEFDEDELHEMKVMDNKLFDVVPRKGKLQPGETQTITLSYNHTLPGTDRLPVLLKLARGREILLNFIGVTVEPERRYIHFPSNKHMFTPVPVGEKNSPKQIYELYNGGAVPVKFEFDLLPLEILKQENFDHPVFECLNPQGEILPGRTAYIEWRFSPLEAKTYMVDVPILVHNGDSALITFTGVGYDRRVMGDTMPITDQHDLSGVPAVQSVPVPGQLLYLNQERISMGNLPLFSQSRQMVNLTNKSLDHVVSYEWHVTIPGDSQILSIQPAKGTLQPGQSHMCKVTFTACGTPSFYDLDLVCEVTDETEMAVYRKKMKEWDEEKYRQMYEFTITEKDLTTDHTVLNVEERPPSGRLKALNGNRVESEADLIKYSTLPPIKHSSADLERERQQLVGKLHDQFWQKPSPPEPFLIHLGVTARTHNIDDFQVNFPDLLKSTFVDRTLGDKLQKEVEKRTEEIKEKQEPVECSDIEADIVTGVVSNVLRGLLDDVDFHEAVKKISDEPIPYFTQLGEGRPKTVTVPSTRAPTTAPGDRPPTPARTGYVPSPSPSDHSTEGLGEQVEVASVASSVPEHHRRTQDEVEKSLQEEKRLKEREALQRLPEFSSTLEHLLENTLTNIVNEAFNREYNITTRPRLIALPPKPSTPQGAKHQK